MATVTIGHLCTKGDWNLAAAALTSCGKPSRARTVPAASAARPEARQLFRFGTDRNRSTCSASEWVEN
jgi:hypothetical protein